MTREFPDELLSAFLDDELTPAERALVEKHLAGSEADRQLLAGLEALRSDLKSLPTGTFSPAFADRVVQAAVVEAQKHSAEAATASPAPASAPARRHSKPWMLGAAVASAVALAACFLLVVRPWDKSLTSLPGGPVGNISDQVLQSLADVMPAEGETIVLRLHVNKDVPLAAALDAALTKAGIGSLASDITTGAAQWQDAYRKALDAKYGSAGNADLLNSTVAAAEAVFVEAPLAQLDGVINDLTAAVKQPLAMSAVSKLALKDTGEGEYSAKQPFAQKLNASLFRLEKKLAQAANVAAMPPPAGKAKPQQTVRVLILFESE